jgi:type IV secretion system protein VirB6
MMKEAIELAHGMLGSTVGLDLMWRVSEPFSDFSNLVFFQQINEFLRDEIDEFGVNLLGRTMAWVGSIALTLMTLWISIQGYRIVTGQSRESMMALVASSLRAVLIVGLATGLAIGGSTIYRFLSDDVSREITRVVTGNDQDAYAGIDRSLGYMQFALGSIDSLQVGENGMVEDAKTRAMWFTGLGTGGPAITAGTMLLLNKIAIALFVGLGPLFVFSLLFEQTKPMFGRWLYYGIGTMFSLAVLTVMVGLALDMIVAVAASFWVGKFQGASQEGINSMAMQQGGLGLILTVLIISAPPMAAAFFQGTLGQFLAYSQFGSTAHASAGSRPAETGFRGQSQPAMDAGRSAAPMHGGGFNQMVAPRVVTGQRPDEVRQASQRGMEGFRPDGRV